MEPAEGAEGVTGRRQPGGGSPKAEQQVFQEGGHAHLSPILGMITTLAIKMRNETDHWV